MTPQPQIVVVAGRDASVKSSWGSVKAHQLLNQGALVRFSQEERCCPEEPHITVIPLYLSQAFSLSFEQGSQCVVVLTADKWVWWCIRFVPSQANSSVFSWSYMVGVLQRLGE